MRIRQQLTLALLVTASVFASLRPEVAASRPRPTGQVVWTPDYTLRIQVVGYEDLVVHADEEPADELLRELKVPVTIGIPFHGTLKKNHQIFSVSGKITRMQGGQFRIKLKCSDHLETGRHIYDKNGQLVPETSGCMSQSSVAAEFGIEICVGEFGGGGERTRPDGLQEIWRSKTRFKLRLEDYRAVSEDSVNPSNSIGGTSEKHKPAR